MLLEPGVIGRALDCEIERQFEAVVPAGGDEAAEILERPELGMNRIMTAFGGTDRIGAAGIAGRRLQRIVAPFAMDTAYRMDRREIDDIESQRRDFG